MNKKFKNLLFSMLLMTTLLFPMKNVSAQESIKLWINGNYVQTDTAPVIENNRTLVPVRVISENLGIPVEWNAENQQILLQKGETVIAFEIGKAEYGFGDIPNSLDVAPKIINNRTMVPVRAISEIFENKVDWDNTNRTVVIGDGYVKPIAPQETGLDANKLIQVDGGNLSGYREPNVKVNVGFGNREYWAYTNEHGQLVKVSAKQIILQDEINEPVKSNGRYYYDEAKVPGTESPDLDEGHVIADSLGGVSNAYNITPQNSTLNRHGDQAYMEKVIRDAIRAGGSCTDFVATITYPNSTTQIPNHYNFKYVLNGIAVEDSFNNANPDVVNKKNIASTPPPVVQKPVNTPAVQKPVSKGTTQNYIADTKQGVIKGNRKSKIYHVPGGASYNRISVNNTVYFNSESDAQAAGYRRAKK